MPFDPQVQAIHDRLERDQPARLYTMSIEDARAADVARGRGPRRTDPLRRAGKTRPGQMHTRAGHQVGWSGRAAPSAWRRRH
jgi:hypothetical protein